MAWVAVDRDGSEWIYGGGRPYRGYETFFFVANIGSIGRASVVFILYTVFTLNSIIVSDINTNGIPIWFGWFNLYNLICK